MRNTSFNDSFFPAQVTGCQRGETCLAVAPVLHELVPERDGSRILTARHPKFTSGAMNVISYGKIMLEAEQDS